MAPAEGKSLEARPAGALLEVGWPFLRRGLLSPSEAIRHPQGVPDVAVTSSPRCSSKQRHRVALMYYGGHQSSSK